MIHFHRYHHATRHQHCTIASPTLKYHQMHINKVLQPYRKKEKHPKCENEREQERSSRPTAFTPGRSRRRPQREKTEGKERRCACTCPVYEGGESDGEVGRNGFSGGRGKARGSGEAGGGGDRREARADASQFLRSGLRRAISNSILFWDLG